MNEWKIIASMSDRGLYFKYSGCKHKNENRQKIIIKSAERCFNKEKEIYTNIKNAINNWKKIKLLYKLNAFQAGF